MCHRASMPQHLQKQQHNIQHTDISQKVGYSERRGQSNETEGLLLPCEEASIISGILALAVLGLRDIVGRMSKIYSSLNKGQSLYKQHLVSAYTFFLRYLHRLICNQLLRRTYYSLPAHNYISTKQGHQVCTSVIIIT